MKFGCIKITKKNSTEFDFKKLHPNQLIHRLIYHAAN